MSTIYTEHNSIHIPFPQKKYTMYLKTLAVKDEKHMEFGHMKQIFLLTIADFEQGMNSPDDIAEISEKLLMLLKHKKQDAKETKTMEKMFESAAELSFYMRMSDHTLFSAILRDIRAFAKTEHPRI